MNTSYCFLTVGKTRQSSEAFENKKYIGVGSSYVLAVNPTKKELESLYGHEVANEPEYVVANSEVPTIRIDFIVKTDPEQCNGIDTINKATFFLSDEQSYNSDKTKVQVIDDYGNSTWAYIEDAKMGKKIQHNGKDAKIAPKYRPAYRGEVDLIDFLKAYLGVEDVFNYVNGSWVMKDGNLDDYRFSLEHIKDYFKGNVSELKEALTLQPNNKVKFLYGVRTSDRGQFQTIATRSGFVLRNNAGNNGFSRLEKQVASLNSSSTEYEVCPLREYTMKADNSEALATASDNNEMPWD